MLSRLLYCLGSPIYFFADIAAPWSLGIGTYVLGQLNVKGTSLL